MIMNCPNCKDTIATDVAAPVQVLCNGRGEHMVSASVMSPEQCQSHLQAMNRSEPAYDPRLPNALKVLESVEEMCLREGATDDLLGNRWKGKAEGIRYALDTIRALVD